MLVEVRKILFPTNLLSDIFLKECAEEGIVVPNSQIQGILIEGDTSPKVAIQFMTANPDTPVEVPLSQQFILSAMIVACRDFNVPLPRYAEKTFMKHDKGLALVITLNISTHSTNKQTHAAHGLETRH